MKKQKTNFDYLTTASKEDFAKILCHLYETDCANLEDNYIKNILEKYKNTNPKNYYTILMWLDLPFDE